MRTVSAAQTNLLALPTRATHVRVKVYSNSTWYNLSDLDGYDWLLKASVEETVDNPCAILKASFNRKVFDLNLSPLMSASKYNVTTELIDIALPIVLETATMPIDEEPASGDWVEIFRGVIDTVDFAGERVDISARDQGGDIQDWFIETQQVYGSGAGVRVEIVMQDILDDHNPALDTITPAYTWNGTTTVTMSDTSDIAVGDYIGYESAPLFKVSAIVPNTSATITNPNGVTIPTGSSSATSVMIPAASRRTIYTENGTAADPLWRNGGAWNDSPGWMVKTFKCAKTHLLDYLRQLAQQIGWDVKYNWQSNTAAFDLLFQEPDRAAAVADHTFETTDFFKFSRLAINRANIRNAGVLTYGAADSRTTYSYSDSTSIARYGRRYMEITEASNSQIDAASEAQSMLQGAIKDLKDPTAELAVDMPYFWPVQINDYYEFSADNDHFDSAQDLAVAAFSHKFERVCTTTLTLRGQPSGGSARWLGIEARQGIAPANDHYEDDAPNNVAAETSSGSLIITYDDPRAMDPPIEDWAYSRLYVRNGSDPGTSSTYLVAVGRQTRFEVIGLVPNATYHYRLEIVDTAGNVSTVSGAANATTRYVNPYDRNPNTGEDSLVENGYFGVYTLGDSYPPDKWEIPTGYGDWGASDDYYFSTSVVRSGERSLHLRDVGYTALGRNFQTEKFPMEEGRLYEYTFVFQGDSTDPNDEGYFRILTYEEDKSTATGLVSIGPFYPSGSTWIQRGGRFLAPADTRFGMARITKETDASGYDMYVDYVRVRQVMDAYRVYASITAVSATTWTKVDFDTMDIPAASTGGGFSTAANRFSCVFEGRYKMAVSCNFASLAAGKFAQIGIKRNGSANPIVYSPVAQVDAAGTARTMLYFEDAVSEFEYFEVWAYHDDTTSRNVTSASVWNIEQLEDA